MKYLRLKCDGYCGKIYSVRKGWNDPTEGTMIEWRADPFQDEIRNDPTPMWLCDECERDSAMDI